MAFSQRGYPSTQSIASRTDGDFDRVRDRPASRLAPPAKGSDGIERSSLAGSAVGVPGYYASQRGLTRTVYRRLTALAKEGKQGSPEWYELQGVPKDVAKNPSAAEAFAMIKIKEADSLAGFNVSLEKDDITFLERIRQERQTEAFDQWLVRQLDFSNPETSRWLQEIYPDFFSRREAYIDDKINLEARLAKIRLRGWKNSEDLKLIYAIETGMIKPPTEPLFGTDAGGSTFTQGYFSVLGALGLAPTPGSDTNAWRGGAQTVIP